MPQNDPLEFALILAAGLTFIVTGAWGVMGAIRDTTMDPIARLAVLAVLVLCFPIAGLLWLLATSADLPTALRAPLRARPRL